MLTVLRDDVGHLTAACAWYVVDKNGTLDPYGGWVFVEQLEVSKGQDVRMHVRNIIADILWRAPTAHHGYWERRDSTGPGNTTRHVFSRERFTAYLHQWMEVMG